MKADAIAVVIYTNLKKYRAIFYFVRDVRDSIILSLFKFILSLLLFDDENETHFEGRGC